jgi:hypothetical protein
LRKIQHHPALNPASFQISKDRVNGVKRSAVNIGLNLPLCSDRDGFVEVAPRTDDGPLAM